MSACTVGVVEAQPLMAESIERVLASSGDLECAGRFSGFAAASAAWEQVRPAAAIVDPALMGTDCAATLQRITGELNVPLLLFARRLDVEYLHFLLSAGAGGVISTTCCADALLEAVRMVSASHRYVPAEMRIPLSELLLAGKPPGYLRLSCREREVLLLAARGSSSQAIGELLVMSPFTAKAHLRNAYAKLGVSNRAAAASELVRLGVLDAVPC